MVRAVIVFRVGILSVAALGGAAAVLVRSERPKLRVSRHRVPWPGLPERRRIVHLTDVHVGWTTPPELLQEVVQRTRAERPSLVALTGDYVNTSLRHFHRMEALVRALPQPVVAVLGNHDHLTDAPGIERRLTDAGARVLRNATVEVEGLRIVGVDDGYTRQDDVRVAFQGVPDGVEVLVLTHFPPTAERIAPRRPRLVLAGHTHGGQLDLPGRLTERLARAAWLGPYLRGFHELEHGARLYVNAGLGHSRRGMRWGESCRPEMAVFDLDPAASDWS